MEGQKKKRTGLDLWSFRLVVALTTLGGLAAIVLIDYAVHMIVATVRDALS